MKAKRFFYHYNKQNKGLTVHYNNVCISVNNIICLAVSESKWNKQQPYLVIQGFTTNIDFEKSESGLTAIIN